MTEQDKPRCENCWHWQRFAATWGECQREGSAFPETRAAMLCSEHEPLPPPPKDNDHAE